MREGAVVASCVAVKWVLPEPDAEHAAKLLESDTKLFAPDFTLVEIGNILWKNERLARISADIAGLALVRLPRYYHQLVPTGPLLSDALALARELDHPVYDCIYVVASRLLDLPLVTSDASLVAKLAGTPDQVRVILLDNWKP